MNEIQKSYLLETAKWQKVIGILMAIGTFFMAAAGIVFIVLGGGTEPSDVVFSERAAAFASIGPIGGIIYLLCAVLYFFFARYLLRAAKYLKAWGASDAEEDLTEGLKNNKSFFKLSGIVSLIGIGLALIMIICVAIAAIAL